MRVIVGIDVGGTNTDGVVAIESGAVIGSCKHVTTDDVITGLCGAMVGALDNAMEYVSKNPEPGVLYKRTNERELIVERVHIGTTHFVNALVQRRHLVKVAVIRLCGPASGGLPPFSDFPEDLAQVVAGPFHLVNGGLEYNGSEITPLDPEQLRVVARDLKEKKINNAVISGVFSLLDPRQEKEAAEILRSEHGNLSLTLSHSIGYFGTLEKENASVLNECLKPLCHRTIEAYRTALNRLGLTCPFFLTQNDGTIISSEDAIKMPVLTFSSGPTNSMRGAVHLSGVKNAIVVDIGGTTTDVGVIVKGFPRPARKKVEVGGVRTNLQMPDVLSIGLGGGSIVRPSEQLTVGPDSTGFLITEKARVFGGDTLTTTDVAVAVGLTSVGNHGNVTNISPMTAYRCMNEIHRMLEEAIDKVKTTAEDTHVVLVGGGSILIDTSRTLRGVKHMSVPARHFAVANAVGAAHSQVIGTVEKIYSPESTPRERALQEAKDEAKQEAIKAGAMPDTIQIPEVSEIPVQYLPGNVTQLKVKAVGDLGWNQGQSDMACVWRGTSKRVPLNLSNGGHNIRDGEWLLTAKDIECIALGAAVLGSGGGGSANLGRLMALRVLAQRGKRMRVITPERFKATADDNDLVLTMGYMGAPTIITEKLTSEEELKNTVSMFQTLYTHGNYCSGELRNTEGVTIVKTDDVSYIEDYKPRGSASSQAKTKHIAAVMSVEIGGANSMTPLVAGALMDLPIIDADLMGRAFPEMQHVLPFINDFPPYPVVMCSSKETCHVATWCRSPRAVEGHLRPVCMELGCETCVGTCPMSRNELESNVIPHSVSRAWRLGSAILDARHQKQPIVDTILRYANGKLLCRGKIVDVAIRTEGAFNKGRMTIEPFLDRHATAQSDVTYTVEFQNENLIARKCSQDENLEVLATVPDLITLIEEDSGEVIQTEDVRYGLRVAVITLPSMPQFTTPQALEVVGPRAFGYDVDYLPMSVPPQCEPIPPV